MACVDNLCELSREEGRSAGSGCLDHLMNDFHLQRALVDKNRIRVVGEAIAKAIDGQGRVALLRCIESPAVSITYIVTKPVYVIIS